MPVGSNCDAEGGQKQSLDVNTLFIVAEGGIYAASINGSKIKMFEEVTWENCKNVGEV